MARVFITGSSDGLGRMAAQLLVEQGHGVVLHARNEQRGREALSIVPGAETVVHGDLSSIRQTRTVAEQVNALGSFDAVIQKPKRLIYLSSGLHQSGDASLKDLTWKQRPWQGQQAYSDTKLHDVLL